MTLASVTALLDGARVFASLTVALCFLRLGRSSGDRLYHVFAIAFVLLAVSSALIRLGGELGERSALTFVPRLIAFGLIIAAIIDKNRRAKG
jgi:hypothetical protein